MVAAARYSSQIACTWSGSRRASIYASRAGEPNACAGEPQPPSASSITASGAAAIAAQIGTDHREAASEQGCNIAPHQMCLREAVQQEDGRSRPEAAQKNTRFVRLHFDGLEMLPGRGAHHKWASPEDVRCGGIRVRFLVTTFRRENGSVRSPQQPRRAQAAGVLTVPPYAEESTPKA